VLTFDFNKYRKLGLQDQVLGFESKRAQAKDRIYWQRITLVKLVCRYPPRSYFKVLILGLFIHHAFFKLENICPLWQCKWRMPYTLYSSVSSKKSF
jgi:hypothetical protein